MKILKSIFLTILEGILFGSLGGLCFGFFMAFVDFLQTSSRSTNNTNIDFSCCSSPSYGVGILWVCFSLFGSLIISNFLFPKSTTLFLESGFLF